MPGNRIGDDDFESDLRCESCRKFKAELSALHDKQKQLIEKINKLLRSNEELERFAFGVAHDLQEPLRSIVCHLRQLTAGGGAIDQSEIRVCVERAVAIADRMRNVIVNSLQHARIDSIDSLIEATDCREVLESCLANLHSALVHSGAIVTCDRLPVLLARKVQIARLFQNIISNAIKYRGDSRPEIHISAEKMGAKWKFSIRDNGIGIQSGQRDSIFYLFKQSHPDSAYDGSGLGLALCKNIVERHNGELWVESDGVYGSTFCFTLQSDEAGRDHKVFTQEDNS